MKNLAPGRASVCVDNTIEQLINPAGSPAGGLEPLPNGALLGPDNNVAQFFSDGEQRVSDNYGTVRGDLKISDKDSLVAGSVSGPLDVDQARFIQPGYQRFPSPACSLHTGGKPCLQFLYGQYSTQVGLACRSRRARRFRLRSLNQ